MADAWRRWDGALRTNASFDRADEQLTTHKHWDWKRIGPLHWVRWCHFCERRWPCYWLGDAREVSDARR